MKLHIASASVDAWDRFCWTCVVMAIVGWTLVAVGLLGEVLGWWKDWGQVAVNAGSVFGTIATIAGLGLSAGRRQVNEVQKGVAVSNVKLDTIGSGVQGLREDLSTQWDRQMLAIDRAFDEEEEQTALLEEQAALERQQTELLRDIRDRL